MISRGSLKRLDVSGFFGFHSNPPAEHGDDLSDAPVPALRIGGQLAKWTGNSTARQVRAGLS